jgi:hypothetical protein
VTRLPGITPGAEIWCHVKGKTQVKRILAALDVFHQKDIDPASLSESQWRALDNAVKGGGDPAYLARNLIC